MIRKIQNKYVVLFFWTAIVIILRTGCQSNHETRIRIQPEKSRPQLSAASLLQEAPMLSEKVRQQQLPPVSDRLPENPMLVQPEEMTGTYGGTLSQGVVCHLSCFYYMGMVGYENLVRWDSQCKKIIPNIAQSYTTDDSMKTYIFHLRKGMRWSDSMPFTSEDIVYCFQRLRELNILSQIPALLYLKNVEANGLYEVRFHFKRPAPFFLTFLAQPDATLFTSCAKHDLQRRQSTPDPVFRADCASGSCLLALEETRYWLTPDKPTLNAWIVSSQPSSHQICFVRNPYYWKIDTEFQQLPYVDSLFIRKFPDSRSLLSVYTQGKLHVSGSPLNPFLFEDYFSHMNNEPLYFDFQFLYHTSNVMVFGLNLCHQNKAKRNLFLKRRFRIALSQAIDRGEIIDHLFSGNAKPYQIAPRPESPYYHQQLAHQYTEFDASLSKAYLREAGLIYDQSGLLRMTSGKPLKFDVIMSRDDPDYFYWQKITGFIQADWADLGIDVNFKSVRCRQFHQQVAENNFDAFICSGGAASTALLEMDMMLPLSFRSFFARDWVDSDGEKSAGQIPDACRAQQQHYRQYLTSLDEDDQKKQMAAILDLAAEMFYVMGICLLYEGTGWVRGDCYNVPAVMPLSGAYATPGPSDPCQYYLESF